MEAYYEKIDALGETLLNWADPENQYRGYTEVSLRLAHRRRRRVATTGRSMMQGHGSLT